MQSHHAKNPAKADNLAVRELNTVGFPALPLDLHLEIMSYFPVMPVPTHKLPHSSELNLDGLRTRHFTLSALSQTCYALRCVYLQYAWQRIEVFEGMMTAKGHLPILGGSSTRPKSYIEELTRQLKVVTFCNPSLAKCVRTENRVANITITDVSIASVLRMVMEAFSLFSNLHTVQLNLTSPIDNTSLQVGGYQYPQVQTLSLNPKGLFFADCCPEAQVLVPYLGEPLRLLPSSGCQNLKVLGTTLLSSTTHNLVNFKNLEEVSVVTGRHTSYEQFETLLSLRDLHTIRLRIDKDDLTYSASRETDIKKRVQSARKMISEKEGNRNCKIVVTDKSLRERSVTLGPTAGQADLELFL